MTDKTSDLRPVIESIQRHAGGGVPKMVQLTLFFDEHGRLAGKTDCKVIKLYPQNITKMIEVMFS